jgi:feruloyl esterase
MKAMLNNKGAILCATACGLAFLTSPFAYAANCSDMAATKLSGASVASAEPVPQGPLDVSYFGFLPSKVDVPAFCRIKGTAGVSIGYELWLPQSSWNGRLLSLGNGGFGGALSTAGMADALVKGYAVTANDTGHQGNGRDWMGDPVQVRYWGHDATHLVTGPAKELIQSFYGTPAKFSYFEGCSTGGGQAMEEAEFYPDDYDGIVAGAPGMSYTHLMLSFLWGAKAADRPGGKIPPEGLKLLHQAVLDACDGQDGVKDGLISNPPACHFDPGTLACKPGQTSGCLSTAQVETARLIYQGPRNPRTGEQIYPGFAFGSEADPDATGPAASGPLAYGWGGIQGPLGEMFAFPLLRDMAFHDPKWDWHTFDWDKDVADLDRRLSADITAMNPDLRPFHAHSGKLILYQGWGDPLDAPTLEIEYRREVIKTFAQKAKDRHQATRTVDDFLRVFMAPGMAHCTGGPGPSRFDALAAVRAWVEDKTPPTRLIATTAVLPGENTTGLKPMSRPLCPFPQIARWDGHGDTDAAGSFRCVSAPQSK